MGTHLLGSPGNQFITLYVRFFHKLDLLQKTARPASIAAFATIVDLALG